MKARYPAVTGLVLVCLLPLAGCGSSTPADATSASPPIVSTAEAADVLTAYDIGNNRVNSATDPAGLATIETNPLRTASEAELKVKKLLKQPIPLITSTDPRFMIPAASGGDGLRWFVSTSTRLRGDVVTKSQTYTVFLQKDKASPWLAAYSLTPSDEMSVPAVAGNGASAATAVTDFDDLALPPGKLARRIFTHYSKEIAGKDAFGKSAVLDDQLGNGYKVALQVLRARGSRLVRTLSANKSSALALRTTDGGVLLFSTSTVIDVLEPLQRGRVSLSAGSNEAALAGEPAGASAHKFTITRQQNFLTYIPTKASHEPVTVLAYTDFPISVR